MGKVIKQPPVCCRPSVGIRLQTLRRKRNMTFQSIAKMLKLPLNQYKWAEKNLITLDDDRLDRLATFYKVDVEYLQGKTPHPTKEFHTLSSFKKNLTYTQQDELLASEVKALAAAKSISFQAHIKTREDCYVLANKLKRTIRDDIRGILSRVQDEDADLLGQIGIDLENELVEIFERAMERVDKITQQYIGGKVNE